MNNSLTEHSTKTKSATPISATILTKNCAQLLPQVLAALSWCDEVIVLDSHSTDQTRSIAESFENVSFHTLADPFPGFGVAHHRAVELARNDWILSVDGDEIVSTELRDEIITLKLDSKNVYMISRANYFNNKHITTCGWDRDKNPRLFNRQTTNFCSSHLHERVNIKNVNVIKLRWPMRHYSYRSLDDFLRKISVNAHLFASQNKGKKHSSLSKALPRAMWTFFRSYIIERGFLQGYEGFLISACRSQGVFWKYLMLKEANQQ